MLHLPKRFGTEAVSGCKAFVKGDGLGCPGDGLQGVSHSLCGFCGEVMGRSVFLVKTDCLLAGKVHVAVVFLHVAGVCQGNQGRHIIRSRFNQLVQDDARLVQALRLDVGI